MKSKIDLETWDRKEHFRFFSQFDEPFFGVTVEVDCTNAYQRAKENGISFFLVYLHKALKAANSIEHFKLRIIDGELYCFDQINASPTIGRSNGTFGFSYLEYHVDESIFISNATKEIELVKSSTSLFPANSGGDNVIHFSAMPWLNFTSVSHARNYKFNDSCPKISFGTITEKNGTKLMPVSIHVHHALADGYHVGLFVELFENVLKEII